MSETKKFQSFAGKAKKAEGKKTPLAKEGVLGRLHRSENALRSAHESKKATTRNGAEGADQNSEAPDEHSRRLEQAAERERQAEIEARYNPMVGRVYKNAVWQSDMLHVMFSEPGTNNQFHAIVEVYVPNARREEAVDIVITDYKIDKKTGEVILLCIPDQLFAREEYAYDRVESAVNEVLFPGQRVKGIVELSRKYKEEVERARRGGREVDSTVSPYIMEYGQLKIFIDDVPGAPKEPDELEYTEMEVEILRPSGSMGLFYDGRLVRSQNHRTEETQEYADIRLETGRRNREKWENELAVQAAPVERSVYEYHRQPRAIFRPVDGRGGKDLRFVTLQGEEKGSARTYITHALKKRPPSEKIIEPFVVIGQLEGEQQYEVLFDMDFDILMAVDAYQDVMGQFGSFFTRLEQHPKEYTHIPFADQRAIQHSRDQAFQALLEINKPVQGRRQVYQTVNRLNSAVSKLLHYGLVYAQNESIVDTLNVEDAFYFECDRYDAGNQRKRERLLEKRRELYEEREHLRLLDPESLPPDVIKTEKFVEIQQEIDAIEKHLYKLPLRSYGRADAIAVMLKTYTDRFPELHGKGVVGGRQYFALQEQIRSSRDPEAKLFPVGYMEEYRLAPQKNVVKYLEVAIPDFQASSIEHPVKFVRVFSRELSKNAKNDFVELALTVPAGEEGGDVSYLFFEMPTKTFIEWVRTGKIRSASAQESVVLQRRDEEVDSLERENADAHRIQWNEMLQQHDIEFHESEPLATWFVYNAPITLPNGKRLPRGHMQIERVDFDTGTIAFHIVEAESTTATLPFDTVQDFLEHNRLEPLRADADEESGSGNDGDGELSVDKDTSDAKVEKMEEVPPVGEPVILGYETGKQMEKDFIEGVMANGMRFIAGTDVGTKELDKYGGVRSNEDRVVVNPQKNEITVIDGMGGHAGGSVAAQIIAEIALSEEGDVQDRVLKAAAALREAADPSKGYEGLRVYSDSGAVLAHVRMISKNEAEVSWIGDASVMVLRGKEVFYASQDHAVVSEMVRKGTISEDQALVYLGRNDPGRAIQAGNTEHLVESERVSGLQPGDLILIMSDGISDNLTPEEIAEIIAPAENIQSAYKNVVLKSRARMEFSKNDRSIVSAQTAARRNGVMDKYSDGFRSQPKQDDRSFAIIEVPKK